MEGSEPRAESLAQSLYLVHLDLLNRLWAVSGKPSVVPPVWELDMWAKQQWQVALTWLSSSPFSAQTINIIHSSGSLRGPLCFFFLPLVQCRILGQLILIWWPAPWSNKGQLWQLNPWAIYCQLEWILNKLLHSKLDPFLNGRRNDTYKRKRRETEERANGMWKPWERGVLKQN